MKHKDDCLKKKQIGLLTLLSWQCEQIQCVTNKKKIFFCCCCCSSSSKERVLKTEIHGDVSTLRNVGNINFYFILNRHFLKIKNAFLYVGNLFKVVSLFSFSFSVILAIKASLWGIHFLTEKSKLFKLNTLVENYLTINKYIFPPLAEMNSTSDMCCIPHSQSLMTLCMVMEWNRHF